MCITIWGIRMEGFFNPASVAVIGASNTPFNLGATICRALKEYFLFRGHIYAVNRKGEVVHGCPGFTSLADIPDPVELAIIITPAAVVPDFVEQCGLKGTKNIIIESAGFSEGGDAGRAMQARIDEQVRRYGMRIMGPNCLGTLDARSHFCCFYGVSPEMLDILRVYFENPGSASYVIQSGGVGVLLIESLVYDTVHLNRMVSIGNKSDIDEGDMLAAFRDDPATQVIGMYLENVQNGRKFMEVARTVTKPILVYKVGRTEAGAAAARSHTAGMANNDAVFESACRQTGVIRLKSITELHAMPKIFIDMPPLRGNNIAVFTNSGAFGGIAADLLTDAGLVLPRLSEETQEKLRKTGQIFNVANPVDLGPALPQTYLDIFEILLSAPEVDGLLPLSSIWREYVIDVTLELVKMCAAYGKPAAIYAPNAVDKIIDVKRKHRMPMFETPEEAVRALAVSYQHYRGLEKKRGA